MPRYDMAGDSSGSADSNKDSGDESTKDSSSSDEYEIQIPRGENASRAQYEAVSIVMSCIIKLSH